MHVNLLPMVRRHSCGKLMTLIVLAFVITFGDVLPVHSADAQTDEPTDPNFKHHGNQANLTQARKRAARRQRRIIYYDDGAQTSRSYDSPETFLETRLNQIIDTQVDSVWYCTSSSGTIMGTHLSKTGDNYADLPADVGEPIGQLRKQVLALKAHGTETLRLAIDFCHQRDMEVLFSLRMNDIHDSFSPAEMPPWKREHLDFVLGKPEDRSKYPESDPRWFWSAWNYEIPAVREKIFRVLEDVCQRYDVDGLHLDYWRHIKFFPPTQELQPVEPRHVKMMNDFLRRIRQMTKREGRRRGRPLIIAASVPLTVERSLFVGLDIKTWLKEDLVDVLAGDGGYTPQAMAPQVRKLTALTHQYGVPFYPCISRKGMVKGPLDRRVEAWRGTAMNIWHAGGDGILVYDFNPPEDGYEPLAQSIQKLNEIGSPQLLKGLEKLYSIDHTTPVGGYHLPGWVVPNRLPITCAPGSTVTLPLSVGEDIVANAPDGKVAHARLRLQLSNARQFDIPMWKSVRLNDQQLNTIKSTSEDWLEFEIDAALVKAGDNLIELQLRTNDQSNAVVWNFAYLEVHYQDKPFQIPIGTGTNHTISIVDADGTRGSLTLDQAVGVVRLTGGNVRTTVDDGTIVLEGERLRFFSLAINDSRPDGSLAFQASGGDGRLGISDIVVKESIGRIDADCVDLEGKLTTVAVKRIELGNVSQSYLTIGTSGDLNDPVSILFQRVRDVTLQSELPIESITATDWLDTDQSADVIRAPRLAALRITGDARADVQGNFQANLALSDNTTQPTLGDVTIAGQIGPGIWKVVGDVQRIEGGSIVRNWQASVLGTLGRLHASHDASGYVAAQTIGEIHIEGNASSLYLFAGTEFGQDGLYGGDDDRFASGSIGKVKIAGNALDVFVGAGLDPNNGVLFDGDDALFPDGRLGALTVKGNTTHSHFLAAHLPKTFLGGPTPSLGKEPWTFPNYQELKVVYEEDFDSVVSPTSIKHEPFEWRVDQPDEDVMIQPLATSRQVILPPGTFGIAGGTTKPGSGSEIGWFERPIQLPQHGSVLLTADVWVAGAGNSNIGLNVGDVVTNQGVLWGPVDSSTWIFDPEVIAGKDNQRIKITVANGEMVGRRVTVKIWVDLDNKQTWGSISNGTNTYTTEKVVIARSDLRSVLVMQYGRTMDVDNISLRRTLGPGH